MVDSTILPLDLLMSTDLLLLEIRFDSERWAVNVGLRDGLSAILDVEF